MKKIILLTASLKSDSHCSDAIYIISGLDILGMRPNGTLLTEFNKNWTQSKLHQPVNMVNSKFH